MIKSIKFNFMYITTSSIWHPMCEVTVKDLGDQRYLFRSYPELDIARIMNSVPWSYENNLLVLKRIGNGDVPQQVPLNVAAFWIQVLRASGYYYRKLFWDVCGSRSK